MRANSLDAKQLEIDGVGASGGSNPNLLINGNFDIWQRGTSHSTSRYGSADRWNLGLAGMACTFSQQTFTIGQTNVPNNPKYFMRTAPSGGSDAGDYAQIMQRLENVSEYSGKSLTVSFWAKSAGNSDIAVGVLQYFGTGGSPSSSVRTFAEKVTTTGSWQKFTVTFTLPSVSGKTLGTNGDDFLQIEFWLSAGSNWNSATGSLGHQSDSIDFAQIKVEEGDVATPFEPRSFGEELALCQRYFCKSYSYETVPATITNDGVIGNICNDAGACYLWAVFPIEMRSVPTITFYSPRSGTVDKVENDTLGTDLNATVRWVGTGRCQIYESGTTGNHGVIAHYTADAEL